MIWGFSFVAQRIGAEHMGAFSFNSLRFVLGALSLAPVIWWFDRRSGLDKPARRAMSRGAVGPGLMVGAALYTAATLQQIAIADTSAGKAAFISGLYIVIVPLLGLPLGHAVRGNGWLAVVLASAGLYLLSVTEDLTVVTADVLLLGGALCWAVHILVIDFYAPRTDPLRLSMAQFLVCSLGSGLTALVVEPHPFSGVPAALGALLFSGLIAVGVAYTFQVLGQRHVRPATAALLFSMEAVFGVIGGALILGEFLGLRAYAGCALMLTGILVAQAFSPNDPSGPDENSLSVVPHTDERT